MKGDEGETVARVALKGASKGGGVEGDDWPLLTSTMLNSISNVRRFKNGNRAAGTATENVTMSRAHTAKAIAMPAGVGNTADCGGEGDSKEGAEEGDDGFGDGDFGSGADSGAGGDGGFAGGIEGGGADREDGDNTEGGPAVMVKLVSNWSTPVELEARGPTPRT